MNQIKPKFPMDGVPLSLWEAVAGVQSPGFADSYLYGAVLRNGKLYPRTVTAFIALSDKASTMLGRLEVELVKPKPFPEQNRPSAGEELASHFARKAAA